jgi:hypothetical protein
MPFGTKAAFLDNASRGGIAWVQQRLDANQARALQRPAGEKDGRSRRESVALGVGGDPIADADDLPVGVEDELAVTQSPGDTHFQPGSPDQSGVPRGRLPDRRDSEGNPNAQRPDLLSTDPRQRRLLAVAPPCANRRDVIVLPAAQFNDAIAEYPGMNHLGHAAEATGGPSFRLLGDVRRALARETAKETGGYLGRRDVRSGRGPTAEPKVEQSDLIIGDP